MRPVSDRRAVVDPTWTVEAERYLREVLRVGPDQVPVLAQLAVARLGRRAIASPLADDARPRLHEAIRAETWLRQEHPRRAARRARRVAGSGSGAPVAARRSGRLRLAGVGLVVLAVVGTIAGVAALRGDRDQPPSERPGAPSDPGPGVGNPIASGIVLAETSKGDPTGRAGVVVVLRRPDGEEVARATTADGGTFELVAPEPAAYLITVDLGPGYESADGQARATVDVNLADGSLDGIEVRMVRV